MQNIAEISYATPRQPDWYRCPGYLACLVPVILNLLFAAYSWVVLGDENGWSRLGLMIVGSFALPVELLLVIMPTINYLAVGKASPISKIVLAILGSIGFIITAIAVALALFLPSAGGC